MTVFDAAEIVVGELAANAVTHGCVAGRDFEVMMRLRDAGALTPPPELGESGRGLLLVEALADRWSVRDRVPVGKTVRAELDIPLPPVRPRTRD